MKKAFVILAVLLLAVSMAFSVSAEEAEDAGVVWRQYTIRAVWVTADREAISIPNLRADGTVVLVRLEPTEGVFALADLKDIGQWEIVLTDAEGNDYLISSLLLRDIIQPEGGGFPSQAEEQRCVDLLFFLDGGEEMLSGAGLKIDGETVIPLDPVPREMPAAED